MSRITLTGFVLRLILFSRKRNRKLCSSTQTKKLRPAGRYISKNDCRNGSVTMDLDLDRLNGINSAGGRLTTLHFATAANSFFPILVFNDQLRGPEPGSMTLVAEAQPVAQLPATLAASLKQLVIEKLSPDAPFDLAVRDARTGFTFFKIEGHQYDYQSKARSLNITGGRLVVSTEFAESSAACRMLVRLRVKFPSARRCNPSRS